MAQSKHQPPPTRYGTPPAVQARATGIAPPATRYGGPGNTVQPMLPATLGAVGLVVGGMMGGPGGAVIGGAIGGMVGAGLSSCLGNGGGGGGVAGGGQTNRPFAADPACYGGSYGQMKLLSARGVREADHIPPKSTYAGSPYAATTENAMPAVSIPYAVHRGGQSGGGGGVSTTGSHGLIARYRAGIQAHMMANQFTDAMILAINDQKNAAPNALNLARGQTQAAEYAARIGLIPNDQELARVIEAINRISY